MTISVSHILTLDEFLEIPDLEASSAWEYINGVAIQKPMPKTRHSLLKKRLMVDPDDASIVVFSPQKEPHIYRGDRILKVIDDMKINLTAKQIFS